MKLSGAERAFLDRSKVRDYLRRFKAEFFIALGYSAAGWEELAAHLLRHAIENEAVASEIGAYGQKYVVRGSLRSPPGRSAVLVAVWIVLRGEDFPRFVTAFPGP